jgi:DNA helicase-2/ATP-dependent DNA helicase PcrA
MSTTPEFETGYKRLNTEQKKAVDTIDGPVMVIAGPGTGKTQILALRIANILQKTDTSADSILALTFTESGVHSMRARLVSIIGPAAYKVAIFTFHGFCNDVIHLYPEAFPRILGSTPATDVDQIQIIEEALQETTLELLKPYGDPFYYVRPLLSIIRSLKRENVGIPDFENIIAKQLADFDQIQDLYHEKGAHKGKMKGAYTDLKKSISKNQELLKLYVVYEQKLSKRRLYDFEDMIREVVKALETNSDLLLQLQEKHQYILADEHQDANAAQNKLLELLSNFHQNPNLFIVGDEKQAIFRFQGASLDNFLYFKKLYPEAVLISLKQNYRSEQGILDAAHSLISNNKVSDNALRVELKANRAQESLQPISLYEFTTDDFEHRFIVEDIEAKIKAGVSPKEIAIIYRENRDAEPLVRCFEKSSVPFTLFSDQNILDDFDLRNFILLLRMVNDFGKPDLLAETLYASFLKLPRLDIFKITHFAYRNRKSIFDVLGNAADLETAGVQDKQSFEKFIQNAESWDVMAKNKGLVETFEFIARESGFLSHLISEPGSLEKMSKLDNLFTEAKKIAENNKEAKLRELITFLDAVGQYNILLKTGTVGAQLESVCLMTAHKSKGLEFEHVYIIGTYDGHWGNKRQTQYFHVPLGEETVTPDPVEDERRLFYVALTRAKKTITLSYARTGGNKERLPTQFINEINPAQLKTIPTESIEAKLKQAPEAAYAPKLNHGLSLDDQTFIQHLFLEQGWSVTALNTYLRCPWDYFFTNLIRIPVAETKHQLYGTAIHATLKEYFKAYARDEDYSLATILELFEGNLKRLPFSLPDYQASLQKGKQALEGYFKAYKGTWPRSLLTEYAIKGVTLPITVNNEEKLLPLRGVLDKVEILQDREVNVVDYKTAKPQTRNELMGKTKTATGDYVRQLMFYKLLLDTLPEKPYVMKSGEIDFIEPDEKGNYHKERFEITDAETTELISIITAASQDIYSGAFWDKRCDDDDCEFCHLRDMIQKNKN